jgi:hypothetical protein
MKPDFIITTHPQNSNVTVCQYPDGGMRHATQADLDLWEEYQKTLVDTGEYKPSEEELELLKEMEQSATEEVVSKRKKGKKLA